MPSFQDYEKIELLLQDYFKAVSNADIARLKTIFHEKAAMYGYLGDNAVIGTPEIFFADLSSKPSMPHGRQKHLRQRKHRAGLDPRG